MSNNYVVYHLHSDDSLLDSRTKYWEYIRKAKELGQKAICFTEHANIFNWIEKKMYCESTQYKVITNQEVKYFDNKQKCDNYLNTLPTDYARIVEELKPIKYIHGIEAYLTEDEPGTEERHRDNYHTILIAKNMDGFRELNSIIDKSTNKDHFYYKPRISFSEFLALSDNIIKISACIASPLCRISPDTKEKEELYFNLLRKYDYLEIQPHVKSQTQKDYNKKLVIFSKQFNIPLIAATDTHSLDQYSAECRTILQISKGIEFSEEDEFDLTYKSYNEVVDMFKQQAVVDEEDYLEALENTNRMADSVFEFELDTTFKYPKLYDNEEEVLINRIHKMYQDKVDRGIIEDDPIYMQNVEEELRVFRKIGMIGFMLFMSELTSWCWENNIPVGFCRGSCGGSTIAYLTDIIDVNPIKWHTIFSRFANENRKEIGDIDVDIAPIQRELVYKHIIDSFGIDKTAYVLAITTVAEKGAIDDIARALAKKYKDKTDNPYSLDKVKAIKALYELDPEEARKKYKELFYYFDGIVGTNVAQSMHPAGIVVAPLTLPDNYGTFWSDGKRILTINMEEIHEVSLVKYDILGLKNIGIIKDTCELANIKYPKSHEINWEDEEVWKHITDSPVGIFQFEGNYAYELLKRFQPRQINDMSLVNASLRPSGESYRDDLLARKKHKNPSKMIDDLLADNEGYLIYQEDTIKFLTEICGLSGSDADNVRRAIGRKQIDRLQEALPQILEGYCSKSDKPREVAEEEAKQFLQIIEDSSNYQFGYNHSTGYSMIGYVCGYLRYYYPTEFITAYLNNANNDDDIQAGTALAKQYGIQILPIKFGHSRADYACDAANKRIYKGVASIKNLNNTVSEELYTLSQSRVYDNFIDLLIDITEKTSCNSRQLDILIKLDYFSDFGEINELLWKTDIFNRLYDKKKGFKKSIKQSKLGLDYQFTEQYCTEFKPSEVKEVNVEAMLKGFENHMDQQVLFKTYLSKCERHKKDGTFNGYNYPKLFELSKMPEDIKQKFATKVSEAEYKGVDGYNLLVNLQYNGTPCSIKDKIKYQQEFLSYIDYINPEIPKNIVVVTNLNTNYSPKFVAYCLNNGKTCPMKVRKNKKGRDFHVKNTFKDTPFAEGDLLQMIKCKQEPKAKMVDGEWTRDYLDKEWWLYEYAVKE